jgi:hypothetical protein
MELEDERIDAILESIETPTIRVETKQDIIEADTLWKIKEKKNQIQKRKLGFNRWGLASSGGEKWKRVLSTW